MTLKFINYGRHIRITGIEVKTDYQRIVKGIESGLE